MLVDAYHVGRIADKTVGQLRHVHQSVFLDTDVDKAAKVGDVGHDAGQFYPFLQVIQCTYVFVKLKYLYFLARVSSGFIQLLKNIRQGG